MQNDLVRLQTITLGSLVVLIVLCVVLVGLCWLAMNLSELAKMLERSFEKRQETREQIQRRGDNAASLVESVNLSTGHPSVVGSLYTPGQRVFITEDFVIDAGLGQTITAGTPCELIGRKHTSGGIRWSAVTVQGAIYIPYMPEEIFTFSEPQKPLDPDRPLGPGEIVHTLTDSDVIQRGDFYRPKGGQSWQWEPVYETNIGRKVGDETSNFHMFEFGRSANLDAPEFVETSGSPPSSLVSALSSGYPERHPIHLDHGTLEQSPCWPYVQNIEPRHPTG